MRNHILAVAIGAACAILGAASSRADIVTLGQQSWDTSGATILSLGGVPSGNQVDNTPCIICGANQPNQTNFAQNFGYTDFGNTGNQTSVAYFSSGILRDTVLGQDTLSGTNYSGAQLANLLTALGNGSLSFSIGVDMNDTGTAQTLESFYFLDLTAHSILYAYSPGPGGTLLPSINNGTGFPDYTLNGLTLDGLDLTHQYAFFARISGANDGPDSFFIVPQAVPGPLMGAGLPGVLAGCLGLWGLHRRRRASLSV